MVHAKNYAIVSTFVKVMQKKTMASFFRIRCSLYIETKGNFKVINMLRFSVPFQCYSSYLIAC